MGSFDEVKNEVHINRTCTSNHCTDDVGQTAVAHRDSKSVATLLRAEPYLIRNRGLPTTVWASTTQDVGDDLTANVRADVNVESKNAVIDCRLNSGRDSVAVDFDTADSTMGPLRITKHLELNGRKVGTIYTSESLRICDRCMIHPNHQDHRSEKRGTLRSLSTDLQPGRKLGFRSQSCKVERLLNCSKVVVKHQTLLFGKCHPSLRSPARKMPQIAPITSWKIPTELPHTSSTTSLRYVDVQDVIINLTSPTVGFFLRFKHRARFLTTFTLLRAFLLCILR